MRQRLGESVGVVDRAGLLVSTLGRVLGYLQPDEIAVSRDFIGEFVWRFLPRLAIWRLLGSLIFLTN